MGRPPLKIDVAKKDHQELRKLLKGGVQQVRVVLRALALLQLAEDASAPQIAKVIPLTPQAIRRLGHRYEQAGLDGALYEKQRPGAGEVLDTNQKQRIIAMVCSDPPEGRARWTVRLVAEEAVKRKLVPRVGRETIRILLRHHDLSVANSKISLNSRIFGDFDTMPACATSSSFSFIRSSPSFGLSNRVAFVPSSRNRRSLGINSSS
jgi:transposase